MFALQPGLLAHNVSGYIYPFLNSTVANLLVYNSADLASANATLRPLYDFAASEMSQNRSVQINATGSVLTEYFQIFGSDPSTISEDGVGIPAILGRRLAPITALQGERAESMANFLENYPGPVGTQWFLVAVKLAR